METKIFKYMLCSLVAISFISMLSAAQTIGVSHQFYGEVYVNGAPAADGLSVIAKVDGIDVASTTTLNGEYGYAPNFFYIDDTDGFMNGSTIFFYVADVESGSFIFENGVSTELPLAVSIESGSSSSSSTSSSSTSGGGGSSGGGGGGAIFVCNQEWECGGWTACDGKWQTRECSLVKVKQYTSTKVCDSLSNQPDVSQQCDKMQSGCVKDWKCSEWTACADNSQTRSCKDESECGNGESNSEIRTCNEKSDAVDLQTNGNEEKTESKLNSLFSGSIGGIAQSGIGLILIAIIVAFIILALYKKE